MLRGGSANSLLREYSTGAEMPHGSLVSVGFRNFLHCLQTSTTSASFIPGVSGREDALPGFIGMRVGIGFVPIFFAVI